MSTPRKQVAVPTLGSKAGVVRTGAGMGAGLAAGSKLSNKAKLGGSIKAEKALALKAGMKGFDPGRVASFWCSGGR